MDSHEAELWREIQKKRQALHSKADALRRSAIATFDPRESLRRHPLAGVVTSLGAGVILALLPMLPKRRDSQGAGVKSGMDQALLSLAAGLLPALLPTIVGPLLGLLRRPRGPKDRSRSRPATA
jgi:hypothetical protein